ncbi:MAG: cadherin-like beta sandwich domain-containing protein [Verrucomicrobia bacterium]|nr:cadherin-like beta sandwich domain-containing protein [Verrucomicrobiota bacterium]
MKKLLLTLAGFALLTAGASAQVDVTSSGGTSPVSYTTLKGAFDAINAGTHTGTISIGISADTAEAAQAGAASVVLNASGSGAASYTAITVSPTGGAARTITGAATAGFALIDLNGADNVTFDGLNTGGNSLTIANTTVSATSGTSTFRFVNGATGNTITNCNVQGSGTMSVATNGATIFFSTDGATTAGNDNNTISNCNIGPAGTNLPTKAILGNGSTTTAAIGNSGIVINNNNIFDYFGAAVTSSGIATNGGCNGWSITNNRFYQTAARAWTTGSVHRAIDIGNSTATSGAQSFTITGNIIGYASNTQTGTYALSGGGTGGKFQGIVFNGPSGGTLTTIANNTVASVSVTGAAFAGTSTSAPLLGILIANGNALVNANTIGSQSTTGSLVLNSTTTAATDLIGIYNFSVDNCTVSNNLIGGMSLTTAATATGSIIYGIRINTGTSLTAAVTGNTIGGPVADSIRNNSTSTTAQIIGTNSPNAAGTFSGNTIQNLSASGGTGTSTTASVIGILTTSTTTNQTISQNTIRNLSNSGTGAHIVTGIQFTGSTANVVARNLIYGLTSATSNASAEINGIRVAGGTTIYRNNMIALGAGVANALGSAASNSGTSGINGFNGALGTDSFFHNSIYIGGTATAGSGTSYAFNGSQTTNTRSFRNNIFVNARTNSGATGKHYAVKINGTTANPTGLTINNNVYLASGTGGVFGFFNSADVANLTAWKAAVGQDASSFELDPQYIDPAGATPDLHISATNPTIVESNGTDVGVTDDFDGQTRSGLTPVDIGADAGNFVSSGDLVPPVIAFTALGNTSTTAARTLTATVTDLGSGVPTAGAGLPVLYWRINAGAYTAATATFVSGNTYSFTFGAGVVTGDVVSYYIAAQDGATTPNVAVSPAGGASGLTANPPAAATPPTTPASYTVVPGYAGTYTVGTGGTFASLTLAGGAFATLNAGAQTGDITLEIISDLTGEDGTNALNELGQDGGPFNVTIKPTGAARSVTGSSAGALIRISGADRVTIDGSLTGATAADVVGGDDSIRQLTFTNTNVGTGAAVMAVQIGANNAGANNFTVKNVKLVGQDPTTSLIGLAIGGNTVGGVGTNANARVENISVRRSIFGIYVAGASSASPDTGAVITKNSVTGAGADRVRRIAILCFNHDGLLVSLNDVANLQTNESADAVGIAIGNQALDQTIVTSGGIRNSTITRNRIDMVESLSATGFSAAGITISGDTGGANVISNNAISRISAPATAPDLVAGIFVVGATGSDTRLFYNSVFLSGDRGTVATQSPGFAVAITGTNPTVQLRNNIFATTQIASGGGVDAKTYAIGMVSTTFTNLSANYNAYYSAGANAGFFRSGSLVGATGTDYATLAAWRTATGGDANSVFGDPLFNSVSNLIPQAGSPALGAGTPIAGITVDLINTPRSATNPTIGAYEGSIDIAGPTIVYTPLLNTISTANRTLSSTITDPAGVPTSGTGLPVLYFRKNAGTYVASQSVSTGGSGYDFTFDYTLVGGVTAGDVISYFVAAQDGLGNGSANPSAGATGFTASPPAFATPPATPNSYRISALVAGSYNVGTGETFTSLTNPGGFFEFVNTNVVAGNVTANITSDLTGETGSVALGQWVETGAGNYTMLIRPSGAARAITSSASAGDVISLDGADRVTIDGSLSGGTDRSLSVTNTNTASGTSVISVLSLGAGAGANNNTIKNCILSAGTIGSTSVTTFGIFVGDTTGAANGADNDNLTIQNNQIRRATIGIQTIGATGGLNDNTVIADNLIGDATVANSINRIGLNIGQSTGASVTRNTILNVVTSDSAITGSNNARGLILGTGLVNSSVTANVITGIRYASTGGYGGKGIDINTGSATSNLTLANNMVSDIAGDGWNSLGADSIVGIRILGATGGINLYDNSVNLAGSFTGNTSGTLSAAFFADSTVTALDLRGNIFANTLNNTTVTTDKAYAVATAATTNALFATINYNDYYVAGAPGIVGLLNAVDRVTLTDWRTASGQDVNSISADPLFVSATDLHLQAASPASNAGVVIAGVTTDLDGNPRSALRPEIGADELPRSANAANLTISAGTLSPVFDTATFAYTNTVANSVTDVTVTTTAADTNSTIEVQVNGGGYATVASGAPSAALPLNIGSNSIDVRLTAEGGTPQLSYTIAVTRLAVLTAGALNFNVDQGYSRTITQAEILAVATFSPGFSPSLTSADATSANGGTIGLSAGVSVTYNVPAPAFTGADSFNYLLTNSLGQTAMGTINITVVPPAFPPKPATVSKSGTSFTATFGNAVPGLLYRVQYSPNLLTPFTDVGTATADGTGNFTLSGTVLITDQKGFFRAITP